MTQTVAEPTVADQVAALLATLGDTADEVAARLRQEGVKGDREMATSCPIATLIRREVPELGELGFMLMVEDHLVILDEDTVSLPDGPREFIAAFDRARSYPDLVAEVAA